MSDQPSARKMIQLLLGTFGLAALFAFQNCSPHMLNEVYLMDSEPAVESVQVQVKAFTTEKWVLRNSVRKVSNKDLRLALRAPKNP